MSHRLIFDAQGWEWALALGAAVCFAALWPAVRRLPPRLLALRMASGLLLLALFAKPTLERMEGRFARPAVAVVLDAGPSMAAKDDAGKARLTRAVEWLKSRRGELEERAEVSLFAGSQGARKLSWDELGELKPGAAVLDPASVFSDLASAGPAAARVLLFSDGAFGQGAELEAASRLRMPVDALGIGPRKTRRSVTVTELNSPDFVFLHSRFPIALNIEASELAGGSVKASLWKGERKLSELDLPVRRPFEVISATFTAEAEGLSAQTYRVELAGLPDKSAGVAGSVFAQRELKVEVIRQKYRIMYLAGRPSFEYSHLRAQLKDDPNHELVSFVILRNPENVSPVPDSELSLIPFPASEIFVQSLNQFDLFILENFAYWRFNLPAAYLQNLKNFVSQGGGLLVIGGSNAFSKGGYQGTPLEETLPVTLLPQGEDFTPGLFTPELASASHPMLTLGEAPEAALELWKALPPLDGFSRFSSVRPGSTVLLRHPTEKTPAGQPLPVVAVREFGRGKVMMIGTDSTWRWKLGGGKNWKIASFYPRFWSRAVQYLSGSLELKKVKFSPLPDRMPAKEPATLGLRVFDEHFRPVSGPEVDLRLVWTTPDGRQRKAEAFEPEPGAFQVELTGLAEGKHRLLAVARYRGQAWGEDSVEFLWEAPKGEAPLDRKVLKGLSERTGGRYADLDRADAAELLAALPSVRRERAVLNRAHLWSWPGWLWILCGLWISEWLLRRRAGYF